MKRFNPHFNVQTMTLSDLAAYVSALEDTISQYTFEIENPGHKGGMEFPLTILKNRLEKIKTCNAKVTE